MDVCSPKVVRLLLAFVIAIGAACSDRHETPTPAAPKQVVLGPRVTVEDCRARISAHMAACVPTCGDCRYDGAGAVCRYKPGEKPGSADACVDECREAAQKSCVEGRK